VLLDWQLGHNEFDGIDAAQLLLRYWVGPIVFLTTVFEGRGDCAKDRPRVFTVACTKPSQFERAELGSVVQEGSRASLERGDAADPAGLYGPSTT